MATAIGKVFRDPAPDAAVAGQATLLEALQAGIAGRLAVLDDPDIAAARLSFRGSPKRGVADPITVKHPVGPTRPAKDTLPPQSAVPPANSGAANCRDYPAEGSGPHPDRPA
jgi:hypothetical protein